jgi:hypothetical protein
LSSHAQSFSITHRWSLNETSNPQTKVGKRTEHLLLTI